MVEASCRPAAEGHTRRNARPSETINKQTWLDELVELLKVNLTHLKDNSQINSLPKRKSPKRLLALGASY